MQRIDLTPCRYEAEGKARKTILARDLWFQVLESQIETGTPYLLYKVTHFFGLSDRRSKRLDDNVHIRTPPTLRATKRISAP
jgi:hypothetical protein